jgi:hypothetical protein
MANTANTLDTPGSTCEPRALSPQEYAPVVSQNYAEGSLGGVARPEQGQDLPQACRSTVTLGP